MGGVKTDTNGITSIRGLYAAGEVACTGVHGANRLASNSLLEGLVYSARAGKATLNTPISSEQLAAGIEEITHHPPITRYSSIPDHEEIRHELKKVMWERVGIIRCGESLRVAKDKIAGWSFIYGVNPLTRRELELKNMLTVAEVITEAAILRKGSVGAHYRSDFPQRGERWQRHITWRKVDGELMYESVE